ncbi:hypothetical protein ACHAP7_010369 [Fusarium lateritium]
MQAEASRHNPVLTREPFSLTCRRRHIKCDEVKPRCGGCNRKKARCEYAKSQEETKRTRLHTSPDNSIQESGNIEICQNGLLDSPARSATRITSPTIEQQEVQPHESSTQDIQEPSEEQVLLINSPQPEESVIIVDREESRPRNTQIIQSPQNSHGSHGDYGDITYTQLDPIVYVSPSPAHLPFNPMPMTYESPPDASLTLKWLDLLLGDTAIDYGPLPDAFPDPDGADIFGNSAVQSPTALGDKNVPRAGGDLHNVGLMNAILSLSARHLDIMNRDTPTYAAGFRPTPDNTIGYYYKTLHYCQEAMQYDGYKTSLELLASAFIISAYEMFDGSNTNWEKHLKGVFWIQRSQTIHGHSDGLRQAVWWAWLSQDVWAAFREKRKPFTFWRPNRPLADLNPSELAARAVYNFAHVVGFCARDDASLTSDYIAVKMREADLLSRQLDDWASYLTHEFQPLPMIASDGERSPFPHVWIQPPSFGQSSLGTGDITQVS